MNIPALAAELTAGHPDTGAYNVDDQIAANQLNAVNRSRNITSLSGDDLFSATDTVEFAALTEAKQSNWLSFCGRESVDPFGAANVAFVNWVFGGGSTTISSLATFRTESVSRAVELGLGFVFAGHVQNARL